MITLFFYASCAMQVTPRMLSSNDGEGFGDPSPSNLPREEHQESFEFLTKCATKFTKDCGYLTFNSIVYRNVTLTQECCDNLVNRVGKKCHDGLIVPLLEAPALKGNVSQIAASNEEVWSKCSSIS